MNLNKVSLGYSPASNDILLLGEGLDNFLIITNEFFDTLEQFMHNKAEFKFNVRGKFFKVRIEECPR